MIEEDAVAAEDAVRLAVVDGDPVGVELRDTVGRAGVEGRRLLLRGLLRQPVEFGGRGLVEAGAILHAEQADRLQHAQRAHPVGVGRVFRRLERHADVALRGEVVDLLGLHLLDDANQVGGVGEVAVVQDEAPARVVRVLVEMVDAVGVEAGSAALDAVNLVALVEQEFGEVSPVLPGDPGDQRLSAHRRSNVRPSGDAILTAVWEGLQPRFESRLKPLPHCTIPRYPVRRSK